MRIYCIYDNDLFKYNLNNERVEFFYPREQYIHYYMISQLRPITEDYILSNDRRSLVLWDFNTRAIHSLTENQYGVVFLNDGSVFYINELGINFAYSPMVYASLVQPYHDAAFQCAYYMTRLGNQYPLPMEIIVKIACDIIQKPLKSAAAQDAWFNLFSRYKNQFLLNSNSQPAHTPATPKLKTA